MVDCGPTGSYVIMYEAPKEVVAFSKNLNYISSCPNSPVYGMAFCHDEDMEAVQKMGIPTVLRVFRLQKEI